VRGDHIRGAGTPCRLGMPVRRGCVLPRQHARGLGIAAASIGPSVDPAPFSGRDAAAPPLMLRENLGGGNQGGRNHGPGDGSGRGWCWSRGADHGPSCGRREFFPSRRL
jgi:hypothetical protein